MVGRVGRPSTPSKVVQLRGNPSKKPMASLLDEFSPDVELPAAPAWVRKEALHEYERLGAELERYGLVSQMDRGALVMVACTWGRIVWLETKIAALNRADKEKGEAGMFSMTPNGYKVMSAEYMALRGEISSYFKFCAEFGCTPAARSKVKPADAPQIPLPGFENDAPVNGAPSLRNFA